MDFDKIKHKIKRILRSCWYILTNRTEYCCDCKKKLKTTEEEIQKVINGLESGDSA